MDLIVGLLVCGGILATLYYLVEVRPKRLLEQRAALGAVYECPPGLSQERQAAWVRAVWEVECPGGGLYLPPFNRMRGLQTFACTLCGTEPTYTLACGLCQVDRGQRLTPEQA